jgi:hypothetical protein
VVRLAEQEPLLLVRLADLLGQLSPLRLFRLADTI